VVPETIKKTVTVQRAVPTSERISLTHPEIRNEKVKVQVRAGRGWVELERSLRARTHPPPQVPETHTQTVMADKPVTMIRPGETEVVETTETTAARGTTAARTDRDWTKVPVGLPFTEMTQEAKSVTVTGLREETATVRQTWMQSEEFDKLGYTLEPYQVEVIETMMREEQVNVVETVLEDYEVEVVVSVMNEVRVGRGWAHSRWKRTIVHACPHPRPLTCPPTTRSARSGR